MNTILRAMQSRLGLHGEDKNLLPLPGVEPHLGRLDHTLITIQTTLNHLLTKGKQRALCITYTNV